jgi:hypothetical protein
VTTTAVPPPAAAPAEADARAETWPEAGSWAEAGSETRRRWRRWEDPSELVASAELGVVGWERAACGAEALVQVFV